MTATKDLIVIGGGPAGYVAAIRASQLGIRTRLVERENLGGICLNWGCIPTKALLHAADVLNQLRGAQELGLVVPEGVHADLPRVVQRSREVAQRLRQGVQHLLKKHKVEVIVGQARLNGPGIVEITGDSPQTLRADAILIATGARPRAVDALPVDGDRVWNYRHALTAASLPQTLLIVGAGAIGMEFASFYADLGTQVTVIEAQARVLPVEDQEISDHVARAFQKRGINVLTQTSATLQAVDATAAHVALSTEGGETCVASFDRVLVCAGVVGNSEDLGLETTRVVCRNGCIDVDGVGRTAEPGIYAAGDICGAPMLAHKASHEAIRCVEAWTGVAAPGVPARIPSCTYCRPQVASIGLTEAQARQSERLLSVGRFPFHGNGKALAINHPEGFVKTIFDSQTGELLGAHLVGPDVTELIQGLSLAQQLEATEEDFMHHIFAHPTLSEAIGESVLHAYGRAIHL
ncbi:dihydrolipoyl dehydrogenase [Bordetella sp. 15P40C-2]|uniref:dihydrolipoyl dehydrogenase n=1 Tax=Bordetella sp. 15P40C-2 TaxID=2572246 RepID=UPI0013273719|nr:dihydrolipoyl dehydrogenase [Bordetella sp. 15P40C-2]MVW70974.1 dihydrolipoyl dehydrogenase [Bordetella sp. 15P40C-2]